MTSHQAQAGRQAIRDDSYNNNNKRKPKTRLGGEEGGEVEGGMKRKGKGKGRRKPGGH